MIRMIKLSAIAMTLVVAACAHEPTKPGERADLENDARATLSTMQAQDSGLSSVLAESVGYIVFPKVGQAGLVVGGGGGMGVIFEHGARTGFATVQTGSVGALAGAQKYAELIIIKDPQALDDIKHGRFDFGAGASAVILKSGAATAMAFDKGVAVLVQPLGGAMVSASLSGQRIHATM